MIPYGGNRFSTVSAALSSAFQAGDRLVVVQSSGNLLHIPSMIHQSVAEGVTAAAGAFSLLAACTDEQITSFFHAFADALADDSRFAPVAAANAADVAKALQQGRSTTRLLLSAGMRADMISGLRGWAAQPGGRSDLLGTIEHAGWNVAQHAAPLGVVGFVFEGRPNVFADAVGVLRTGNTVVFRIGSDALGTARSIIDHAVRPALESAGLPQGAVVLVDSAERSAGWALFSDPRLALAVARGSGAAVAELGAVARQAGVPVSLHGTGGAWMVAGESADADRFGATIRNSLDRKVCNTLNVCCIVRSRAAELVPVFIDAVGAAAQRRSTEPRLHVESASMAYLPAHAADRRVTVTRADGVHDEPFADALSIADLGTEWEWESSPEVSLVVVDSVSAAIDLFNTLSPRFGASLIADDTGEQDAFWASIDAPFVGDGFTRWVDGQFALDRPELGLSNWQAGRLLARSGILSGNSVYTVRLRVRQSDPELHR
jgi:glutamate-5-semialdehyde dehydrogenase